MEKLLSSLLFSISLTVGGALVSYGAMAASQPQQQPAANNQQPAANNQQPAANNQQPAVNNQQPAVQQQPDFSKMSVDEFAKFQQDGLLKARVDARSKQGLNDFESKRQNIVGNFCADKIGMQKEKITRALCEGKAPGNFGCMHHPDGKVTSNFVVVPGEYKGLCMKELGAAVDAYLKPDNKDPKAPESVADGTISSKEFDGVIKSYRDNDAAKIKFVDDVKRIIQLEDDIAKKEKDKDDSSKKIKSLQESKTGDEAKFLNDPSASKETQDVTKKAHDALVSAIAPIKQMTAGAVKELDGIKDAGISSIAYPSLTEESDAGRRTFMGALMPFYEALQKLPAVKKGELAKFAKLCKFACDAWTKYDGLFITFSNSKNKEIAAETENLTKLTKDLADLNMRKDALEHPEKIQVPAQENKEAVVQQTVDKIVKVVEQTIATPKVGDQNLSGGAAQGAVKK